MFIQVIQAPTRNADALREASYRWAHELGSTSIGWLGCTSGVTPEGLFITAERFESEQKAMLEAGRPGRRRWWTETSKSLTGEATFINCREVELFAPDQAAIDRAGYIQIVQGRVRNPTLMRTLLRSMEKEMFRYREHFLGSTLALHPDDGYTHLNYFTSDEAVRNAELRETHPRIKSIQDAVYELQAAAPKHHLLTAPWLHTRRQTLDRTTVYP